MVQGGKARKFSGDTDRHVDEMRKGLERMGIERGNPNQTGGQQFSYQQGNISNKPFLEDKEAVSVHGFQMQGGLGFKQQSCSLDTTTKILDITKDSTTSQLFRQPVGHCIMVLSAGTTSGQPSESR